VKLLQAVHQHWPVCLVEHVPSNVDLEVGVHAEDLRVVGAVVDLAERQAVRDFGAAALVAVGQNVGGEGAGVRPKSDLYRTPIPGVLAGGLAELPELRPY